MAGIVAGIVAGIAGSDSAAGSPTGRPGAIGQTMSTPAWWPVPTIRASPDTNPPDTSKETW